MVLMQCRGVDSTKVPVAQRIRPETCWTQTPSERFTNDYNTAVPAWRLDQYAPKSERQQFTNGPRSCPPTVLPMRLSERWVPFVAASGKTYLGGARWLCGNRPRGDRLWVRSTCPATPRTQSPPERKGSAKFNVRSSASNASLGCSDKVPCSLVAIPDYGYQLRCRRHWFAAEDQPTGDALISARNSARQTETTTLVSLRNRAPTLRRPSSVVCGGVPRTGATASPCRFKFAHVETACDIAGAAGVSMFGSELMIQATEQWSPIFCGDRNKNAGQHVQTGEPQARTLLKTGGIDSALVSQPADGVGYTRPVVSAPVAMTGFAVTYSIDGREWSTHHESET